MPGLRVWVGTSPVKTASNSTPGWRLRRGIAPPTAGPSCSGMSSTPAPGTCWLNWPLSRSGRRVALADGQAIFDVVHDARRPFVVEAGGRQVRDVGTQFDVRERGGEFTVTVARGRVEVGSDGSAQPILLGPGQRLDVSPAG